MKNLSPHIFQNLIVTFILIGILFLALGGYLSPLSSFTLSPLVSFQEWLSNRYQAINTFLTAPRDTAKLQARNAELEAEVALLRTQIVNCNNKWQKWKCSRLC
jgi:rod shape-determining protein MreC